MQNEAQAEELYHELRQGLFTRWRAHIDAVLGLDAYAFALT